MKTVTQQIQELMETVRFMEEPGQVDESTIQAQWEEVQRYVFSLKESAKRLQFMLRDDKQVTDPNHEQLKLLDSEIDDLMNFFANSYLDNDK